MTTPGSIPLRRPEPIIRVDGIAHVAFEKPDLALAEKFLGDFGLVTSARTDDALYARGTGAAPHVYVAHRGPRSRYLGAAFTAATRADLERLAQATGKPIEPVASPGGGECVRLTDPAGFRVDVVYGARGSDPLPSRTEHLPLNTPWSKPRLNRTQRPERRASQVARLGHVVMQVVDFQRAAEWYMRHLGLIPTDVQCLDDGRPNLAFLRCDRGPLPADHHTVVVFGGIADAYGHSAYEVLDLDEVAMGQQVLKAGGWRHVWGLGRHILGSQIFDYWKDPWGDEMEHYADGDVFDAHHPTEYHPMDPSLLWMWGEDLPADFGPQLTPSALARVAKHVATGRLSLGRMKMLKQSMDRPARPWLARGRN